MLHVQEDRTLEQNTIKKNIVKMSEKQLAHGKVKREKWKEREMSMFSEFSKTSLIS